MKVNVPHAMFYAPLVGAILGLPDDNLGCDEYWARLPGYLDAEIEGLSGDLQHFPVKCHLLLCPECATAYLELLELALAEEQGRLPRPTYYPEPDLGFLPGECCDGSPRTEE